MKCLHSLPPKSSLHTRRVCHTYGEIGACGVRFEHFGPFKTLLQSMLKPHVWLVHKSAPCSCHIKHASLLLGLIMLFHDNILFF